MPGNTETEVLKGKGNGDKTRASSEKPTIFKKNVRAFLLTSCTGFSLEEARHIHHRYSEQSPNYSPNYHLSHAYAHACKHTHTHNLTSPAAGSLGLFDE